MPKPRFSGGNTSIRLSSSQMPPPLSGCKACDAVERRRLSAARRSEQRDELAAPDVQIEALKRGDRLALRIRETAAHRVEPQLFEVMLHGGSLMRAARHASRANRTGMSGRAGCPDRWLFGLLCADLPCPTSEGGDHRRGIERQHVRTFRRAASAYSGRPYFFRTSWLCAGACRIGDALDRRTRIEVTVVVSQGLLRGLEHEVHQLVEHVQLFLRHALRNAPCSARRSPTSCCRTPAREIRPARCRARAG